MEEINTQSDWIYNNLPIDENILTQYQGFVYLMTNLDTGKQYIGKKNLWTTKTSQKKDKKTGKIKKTKTKIFSDWKDYFSSNDEIKRDVQSGIKYSREILEFCKTKSDMSYIELREQIDRRVLESENFYNGWIMVRVRKSNLTINKK